MAAPPRRTPVTIAALTATVVIAAAASAAVTVASAASAATTTTAAATTSYPQGTAGVTTTVTPNQPAGTVVKRWDFDSGGTEGWTGVSGASASASAVAAKSGAGGLLLSNTSSYGTGASVTFDASDLQDYVWYDASIGLRLPEGTAGYRFQASIAGTSGLATPASSTYWNGAGVHFRKLPGQSTLTFRVVSNRSCPADPPVPAATTYADEARVVVASAQGAITYTTWPCPPATTTTRTTTTSTGDGGAPVPGSVVQSWGFEDGSVTGFSPVNGTFLAVGATAKTGSRGLTVSGVSRDGGLSLAFDTSRLVYEGRYELNVPVLVPAGANRTTFALAGLGQFSRVVAQPGQWTTATIRFVWRGTSPTATATLTASSECPAYDPTPARQIAVDDIVLRAAPLTSTTTTTGGAAACPQPSTTTTTSRPLTTTTTPTTTTPTTTTTTAPPRCRVDYQIVSQWNGGFQSNAVLTNTSGAVLPNWTLTLTFADGQKITQAWGVGSWAMGSTDATFTSPTWARDLAPGSSAYVGMMGSWWGVNNPPTRVLVNGQTCDGQQPTTTTTTTTTRPTTSTTRTTIREDCRWVMAVPGATTGTITPAPFAQITIWGYGLGGMYDNGTITWSTPPTVTGLTGATGWSVSGNVLSFTGLQWSGFEPRRADLRVTGNGVTMLPSVRINGMSCGYGLS